MLFRLLTHNLGWKALSLAAAVLFWISVSRDTALISFVSAPVQYKGIPDDLEISSDVIEQVYLELRGSAGMLERFNDAKPAVSLDFSGVSNPGERTFNIDERAVSLPHGMKLVRSIPSQLRFEFDRRVSRKINVEVRFTGKLQDGYSLASYEAAPPVLTVVGPESRVRRIEYAQTDPIDLAPVVAESQFSVNAFVDDPHVRFAESPRVSVRVVVEKR
jgi:hypothetical protein